MDAPPPIETVCAAITSLYHNPDPKEKERASLWLQELQKSVVAWKVADELLHHKVNMESCYFAAQTMRTKIQNSFHELPSETAHTSLRDSLIEHVQGVDEATNTAIVTQLCLALADLALLMHSEWPTSVGDLTEHLRSKGRTWALLEVLVVLPEEVNSRHLRLGANRREDITRNLLHNGAPIVTNFLNDCLRDQASASGANYGQYKVNVFKCFTSWLSLGVIPLEGIERHAVMVEAFQCLANVAENAAVHETATDCVCCLLVRMETDQEGMARDPDMAQALEVNVFEVVRSLQGPYHMSVANEDMEKSLNFCRVFTELGETMLSKIIHHGMSQPPQLGATGEGGGGGWKPHFATEIFNCVLVCCGNPDYEIPDITFNLWYRLSEELYQRNDAQLTALFRPYIERLINALCKHCQMEPDSEGVLEDGEEFAEFRSRVVELIKDVVFIVGSANVFAHMFAFLRGSTTTPIGWEAMEAALFIMCAVARNLVPTESAADPESNCVAQVVEAVLAMAAETAHMAVRHTSIRLVGELAEWIRHHPEYLERILNWLLVGLQDRRTASESATALQNVCAHCQEHMAQHLNGLIQILSGLDNLGLKPAAATGLIKGVALTLSLLPHDNIAQAMRTLCALQLTPIQALVAERRKQQQALQQNNNGGNNGSVNGRLIAKNTVSDPVLFLDRLAAILRHVNPVNPQVGQGVRHPCTDVVIVDIWPAVSATCDAYAADPRIMERACRTIRFAVRCLGVQSAPLLEPLVKQMVGLYQTHPHSCFLYLGSILVDEFAHDSGCIPGLLGMLGDFLPPTFRLLLPQAQDAGGGVGRPPAPAEVQVMMRNHPDTVDDFFRLNARFLQRAALPYLKASSLFSSVVECALLAASLDHRDANASVMKFFFDLLHAGRNKEDREDFDERCALVARARTEYGPKIVDSLVRAVVLCLPSYTYHDVGDVLFELMLLERSSVCHWLEASLQALNDKPENNVVAAAAPGSPLPPGSNGDCGGVTTTSVTVIMTPKVTREQLVRFHREVTSAEQPSTVIASIREFARLWR